MIKKISITLKKSDSIGIWHDSRKDVRHLAEIINILIEKVNELIEENNKLRSEQGVKESDTGFKSVGVCPETKQLCTEHPALCSTTCYLSKKKSETNAHNERL